MVFYKSEEEIAIIRESAQILGKAHGIVATQIKEGITTLYLDKLAEEFIRDSGGIPSFKGYNGFPFSLCISVNETVVHGFPSNYTIKDGDVVSVDCGVKFNGYHSDSAYTHAIGNVDFDTIRLLERTKESLFKGIEMAQVGNRM